MFLTLALVLLLIVLACAMRQYVTRKNNLLPMVQFPELIRWRARCCVRTSSRSPTEEKKRRRLLVWLRSRVKYLLVYPFRTRWVVDVPMAAGEWQLGYDIPAVVVWDNLVLALLEADQVRQRECDLIAKLLIETVEEALREVYAIPKPRRRHMGLRHKLPDGWDTSPKQEAMTYHGYDCSHSKYSYSKQKRANAWKKKAKRAIARQAKEQAWECSF